MSSVLRTYVGLVAGCAPIGKKGLYTAMYIHKQLATAVQGAHAIGGAVALAKKRTKKTGK